uniref:AIG1-type G domain-containing protein n=1 Tax=Scophthalmus maximus TaxID=52904 RepID=A0A8D3D2U8_SCOMX
MKTVKNTKYLKMFFKYKNKANSPEAVKKKVMHKNKLRLVLLGNLGCGKTSSADTILGQLSRVSPAAARSCQQRQNIIEGRSVTLVEAPRWYWSGGRMEDSVRKETERAMTLVAPGPHAILLLVPVCQFTEVGFALRALETVFGPEAVQRHALVLFTYADRLRASGKAGNESVEAYIAGQRGDLLNLVEKCRDRFHVMESGGGETERRSVAELLEKVEQTVKEAGGQCYSSPAFQEKRGTNQEQAKSRDVGGICLRFIPVVDFFTTATLFSKTKPPYSN